MKKWMALLLMLTLVFALGACSAKAPAADDAAIVRATIALAHNLRLSVVAEGVETVEQLNVLQNLSCDEVQGYYFSAPVPKDEAAVLLLEASAASVA